MPYYTESLLNKDNNKENNNSVFGITTNSPSGLRERDFNITYNNNHLNVPSPTVLPKMSSNISNSSEDENDEVVTFSMGPTSPSPTPSPSNAGKTQEETEDERLKREIWEEAQQLAEERRKKEEEERQKREEMRAKRAAQPKKAGTPAARPTAVATENLSEKQLIARQKREQQRLEMLKWKQEQQLSAKKGGGDDDQEQSQAISSPKLGSQAPTSTPTPTSSASAPAPVNVQQPTPKTPEPTITKSTSQDRLPSSTTPIANGNTPIETVPIQSSVAPSFTPSSPVNKPALSQESVQVKPITFALSPEIPRARAPSSDATSSALTELSNKTKTLLSSPLSAPKPLSFDPSPLRISERFTNAMGANGNEAQKELEKAKEEAMVLAMEYNELQQKYTFEIKQREKFQSVFTEYENTISELIQQQNQAKEQESLIRQKLQEDNERLQRENEKLQQEHTKLDQLFSSLRVRHDELKQSHDAARNTESTLKEKVNQLQQTVATTENQYKALKAQAESKLEAANQQILKLSQVQNQSGASSSKDVVVAKAKLQKAEARLKFLESSFAAKVQENLELHTLCDELINLVTTNRSS